MAKTDFSRAEEAYLIWSEEAERSDRKTSEISGIPQRTIAYYRSRDDWHQRYLAHLSPDADVQARIAKSETKALLRVGVQRMAYILGARKVLRTIRGEIIRDEHGDPVTDWASSDRDSVQALKVLASMAGSDDGDAALSSIIDARSFVSKHMMTPEQKASAILEANVAAVNTRKKKGSRT